MEMERERERGGGEERERGRSWLWWASMGVALALRVLCFRLGMPSLLGRRVEIATPTNSLLRLAEGYHLKQVGLSSYSGSMYHGSPLLLAVLGPSLTQRVGSELKPYFSSSFLFIFADFIAALLLRNIGKYLQNAQFKQFSMLGFQNLLNIKGPLNLELGDAAALCYIWNPFTIVSCVGGCTSSIENLIIILSLYGAVIGRIPLAAFGWALSTHLSLYPAILFIPIAVIVSFALDHPPKKLYHAEVAQNQLHEGSGEDEIQAQKSLTYPYHFKWKKLRDLFAWSFVWWVYIITLCSIAMKDHGGLQEMFSETYGFVLRVEDLSPNLGLFWYFFSEVFDFFRPFFLLVFHSNILFMIIPLTIRLHHRPIFLGFVFIGISTMLKSYPSVGDAALHLGFMPLMIRELSGMRFTFVLLNGYIGVALLSPVMYNLWIWRGTGNANFYFATALVYSCIQLILIIESVSTVLLFDRNLRKLKSGNPVNKIKDE